MYRMLCKMKFLIEFYFRIGPFTKIINNNICCQTSDSTLYVQKEFLEN